MKVSVLMPVWNGERYIREAIGSILSQTHHDFELIIIDDGSTDGTADVVGSFQDPRIRFIRKEHAGKVSAFNDAFSLATGDATCFFAYDDVLHPDSLKARHDALEEGSMAAAHDGWYCDNELRPFRRILSYRGDLDWAGWNKELCRRSILTGGLIMVRSDLLRVIFPLPADLGFEDWWIVFHILVRHYRIRIISRPLFSYRIHGQNTCTSAVCGSEFDEMRLKDWRRHLTFYSVILAGLDGLPLPPAEIDATRQRLALNRELVERTLKDTFTLPRPCLLNATGLVKYLLSQALVVRKGYILQNAWNKLHAMKGQGLADDT